MTPPLGLYAYPWDVLDEGPDAVLAAVERAGLNTLYLTTWYHSGMFFLPHNPRRLVYFPEPGALYFRPGAWHAGHKLAPPVSRLTDDWPGFWERLARAAGDRGIALSAWMPVLHNSGVGNAHPDQVVENPWGDRITHTLCPSNGPVRDLVLAVMRDVAEMGIFSRVHLESIEYLPLRHGHHHEVIGVPLDADTEFLASLCFCPACRARAAADGIDIDAVRGWVRSEVESALAGEAREVMGWDAIEAGAGGEMAGYLRSRESGPSTLTAAAATELRRSGVARASCLDFGPLYPLGANGRRWQNGVDLDRILDHIDELHPTFYQADVALLERSVAAYADTVGPEVALVPALRAMLPQTEDAAGLARQCAAIAPVAEGVSFYNYSFMARRNLDWIRDALAAHPPAKGGAA